MRDPTCGEHEGFGRPARRWGELRAVRDVNHTISLRFRIPKRTKTFFESNVKWNAPNSRENRKNRGIAAQFDTFLRTCVQMRQNVINDGEHRSVNSCKMFKNSKKLTKNL